MKNQLYCGAAKEIITPPEELQNNLRGLMDSRFGGVEDDLYVRVIALASGDSRMLLISFDLDKAPWPAEYLEELERRTGIPQEWILFSSIHTHSAPVTGHRPYEGPNYIANKPAEVQESTKQYEQIIKKNMILAAERALGNMVPARYGFADGKSYVNVNRISLYEVLEDDGSTRLQAGTGTNFEREADRTLFVMKFEDLNGRPLAFLINYPVHNTVMILNHCGRDGKVGITSDLGGNVSQWMECEYEGSVALWSSGAAGDLNPVMSNQVYREDPKTGAPVEYYEQDGNIPRAMLHTLVSHHFADVRSTLLRIEKMQDQISLDADADWAEMPGTVVNGKPVPYRVRVHKLMIGSVTLIGVNGELFSELGVKIKQIPVDEYLILINHDASLLYNTGYIYSDEVFALAEAYPGDIVGINHTWQQPGYAEKALEQCVRGLLETDE